MGVASNLVGICKGGRRELYILTSVRRIHGKRISDAELTIITNLTNLFPIKNDNYWLKIGKIGRFVADPLTIGKKLA